MFNTIPPPPPLMTILLDVYGMSLAPTCSLPPIYNNYKLHIVLRFTIIINCRTKYIRGGRSGAKVGLILPTINM